MMIQVVAKTAAILNLLGTGDRMTFTEVWQGTGLNKTTVAHLLGTLQTLGYVEKTAEGLYRLGPQILELAQYRLRRGILTELAEKQALSLAAELGATVTVAVLRMGERYRLAKATGDTGPVLDSASSRAANIYDTATGRMLLACADEAEREVVLAKQGLPGEHWPEIRNKHELLAALDAMRDAGVASRLAADGQAIESTAVPVLGPDGRVWAALGSSAPRAPGAAAGDQPCLVRLQAAATQLAESLKSRLGDGRLRQPAEA